MRKILCFIGLHDWTEWMKYRVYEVYDNGKSPSWHTQGRVCKACNCEKLLGIKI